MNGIKKIWDNGKTRGIIFLIFYLILFSYIFIVYGKKSEKIILPETKPPKVEKQEVLTNYEYEYIVDENVIKSIKYNDIITFTIDDIDYYYIDGVCYKLEEEKFYVVENPLKYNFDYIGNLDDIKKSSNLVKTINYADGRVEENYDIVTTEFLNIFAKEKDIDDERINYSIITIGNEISEIDFKTLNFRVKYVSFKDVPEINADYEVYKYEENEEWD